MALTLYGYWRSSASWRVRIGLNLKGIAVRHVSVNLAGGDQRDGAHLARNPIGQVPVLELEDGTWLTQSLAILDHLDQRVPDPPLFPREPLARARAFALAEVVNSGIQPLQNLSVLAAVDALGGDRKAWAHDAIARGLLALEQAASGSTGAFLVGDTVSVADVCLVPQLYNARRFGVSLDGLPTLRAIEARCAALPAFEASHPDHQHDAPR